MTRADLAALAAPGFLGTVAAMILGCIVIAASFG